METFVNSSPYLLEQGCLATDTTLFLQGVGGLPLAGTFRMRMGNERLKVTAVSTSLNTITVVRGQEGTSSFPQLAGTALVPVITADGMTQFKGDILAAAGVAPTTVVAIRSYAPTASLQAIQLYAYSTPGDGGGGTFNWNAGDTRPDDGGTIIAVNPTSIAAGSNGASLPQAAISIASTSGLPASGTVTIVTSAGAQTVTYTGLGSGTLTGCSGGTGTMATGGFVAAPGRWNRVYHGDLDVRWFGASLTGNAAANSVAIAMAIAAAHVGGDGGPAVGFVPGTWLHAGFTVAAYVHLVGKGSKGSVVLSGTGSIVMPSVTQWGLKNITPKTTVDGVDVLQLSVATGPCDEWVMEDVTIPQWGATSATTALGINFICTSNNSAHCFYFGRMRNVQVTQTQAAWQSSTCVGTTGGVGGNNGQIIGLSWLGGRCSGAGIGLDLNAASGCDIQAIEFDDINIQAAPKTITGLNTGTATFTSNGHGYNVGDLVLIENVTGTNLVNVNQLQQVTAKTANDFTCGLSGMSGAYTSGGTAKKSTGIAVHLGSGALGNKITGRLEGETLDVFVAADSGSFGNVVDFGPNSAPFPSQITDANGTPKSNVFVCGTGSNGFYNTYPSPASIAGNVLRYGTLATSAIARAGLVVSSLTTGMNDNVANSTWGAVTPPAGTLYLTGTLANDVYISGFNVGAVPDGFEMDVVSLLSLGNHQLWFDHLNGAGLGGASSAGNKCYIPNTDPDVSGSFHLPPGVSVTRWRYVSGANGPNLDSGNGVWMLIGVQSLGTGRYIQVAERSATFGTQTLGFHRQPMVFSTTTNAANQNIGFQDIPTPANGHSVSITVEWTAKRTDTGATTRGTLIALWHTTPGGSTAQDGADTNLDVIGANAGITLGTSHSGNIVIVVNPDAANPYDWTFDISTTVN